MMSYFKNIETNGYYIKIEHRYSSRRRSPYDGYVLMVKKIGEK